MTHIIVSTRMTGDEGQNHGDAEVEMRKIVLFWVTVGFLALHPAHAAADQDLEAFVQESRTKVQLFAPKLKRELQAAIMEGGLIHAIPVCSVKAREIASDMSTPLGWTVGRTSHKIRNPGNAPDDWEKLVLDEFLQRAATGESIDSLEKANLVQSNGDRTYRYMKAIPVGEVCLNCHGSNIDPELQGQIDSLYPEDQAVGFELGELRGAFTIIKTTAN